jgi:hypothetical protein
MLFFSKYSNAHTYLLVPVVHLEGHFFLKQTLLKFICNQIYSSDIFVTAQFVCINSTGFHQIIHLFETIQMIIFGKLKKLPTLITTAIIKRGNFFKSEGLIFNGWLVNLMTQTLYFPSCKVTAVQAIRLTFYIKSQLMVFNGRNSQRSVATCQIELLSHCTYLVVIHWCIFYLLNRHSNPRGKASNIVFRRYLWIINVSFYFWTSRLTCLCRSFVTAPFVRLSVRAFPYHPPASVLFFAAHERNWPDLKLKRLLDLAEQSKELLWLLRTKRTD